MALPSEQSRQIELALSYGYQGIEIDSVHFYNLVQNRGKEFATRLLSTAKLNAAFFSLPIVWDVEDQTFAKQLEQLVEIATVMKEQECHRVLAQLPSSSATRGFQENFDFHVRRFNDIAKLLEAYDMRLGLGFQAFSEEEAEVSHSFIRDWKTLKTFVENLSPSNVAPVFDLFHVVAAEGDMNLLEEIPSEGIEAVFLCDLPSVEQLAELNDLQPSHRLLPGSTGRVDLGVVLGQLAQHQFNGPIIPSASRKSVNARRNIEEAVKLAGEAMDAALQQVPQ